MIAIRLPSRVRQRLPTLVIVGRYCISIVFLSSLLSAAPQETHGLPFEGRQAEEFLETARVVAMEPIGVGITRSQRVTLTDGNRSLRAAWKTIDLYRPVTRRTDEGDFQVGFRDSYKFDVAAYELDKLLGLRIVPPTVERELKGRKGSLQLWVEGSFTELDRRERNLALKDGGGPSMYNVALLRQLTYDTDARNIRNILYDPDFRVYAIDHSRSFTTIPKLPNENILMHFSRGVLERLRKLDRALLAEKLGRWLTPSEIEALLKRRDLIVARADRLVDEWGEKAILVP